MMKLSFNIIQGDDVYWNLLWDWHHARHLIYSDACVSFTDLQTEKPCSCLIEEQMGT